MNNFGQPDAEVAKVPQRTQKDYQENFFGFTFDFLFCVLCESFASSASGTRTRVRLP